MDPANKEWMEKVKHHSRTVEEILPDGGKALGRFHPRYVVIPLI